MVVQHNLTAMNSNRMLGITTGSQAKSTEKLSSGYKINRAADDAAGLSISEKMRKQIRGLTQASLNAQDGISAVQTAEGALNEVQDMLQRANELAVKAANGTMSENDRSYIQDEVNQLVKEMDRVAETTKFNETYLLKGDKDADMEYRFSYADAGTTAASVKYASGVTAIKQGNNAGVASNVAAADLSTYLDVEDDGTVSIKAAYAGKLWASDGTAITAANLGDYVEGVAAGENANAFYDADGNMIAANALGNYIETTDGTTFTLKADAPTIYDSEGNEIEAADLADAVEAAQDLVGALTLKLHVGADATDNNQITIDLNAMSAKSLGVDTLTVAGKNDTNALTAIETIKEAIQKVSTQRSALGAVQNRLEHTIANLDNVVENTTAAESQIRDTDMATEMVKYSNNNILAQAGQSMLAQANQANQGVLSLLG